MAWILTRFWKYMNILTSLSGGSFNSDYTYILGPSHMARHFQMLVQCFHDGRLSKGILFPQDLTHLILRNYLDSEENDRTWKIINCIWNIWEGKVRCFDIICFPSQDQQGGKWRRNLISEMKLSAKLFWSEQIKNPTQNERAWFEPIFNRYP